MRDPGCGYGVWCVLWCLQVRDLVTDGVLDLDRNIKLTCSVGVWKTEAARRIDLAVEPKAAGWPVPGSSTKNHRLHPNGRRKIYCRLLVLGRYCCLGMLPIRSLMYLTSPAPHYAVHYSLGYYASPIVTNLEDPSGL